MLHPVHPLMSSMMGEATDTEPRNEDYAHHLRHAPAPERKPLWLRLSPKTLLAPVKAYLEARAYERQLLRVWEISPHLLDDIGVVLGRSTDLTEDLIEAPDRVVDQVESIERAKAVTAVAQAAAPATPEPKAAAAKKPVRAAVAKAAFSPAIPAAV